MPREQLGGDAGGRGEQWGVPGMAEVSFWTCRLPDPPAW